MGWLRAFADMTLEWLQAPTADLKDSGQGEDPLPPWQFWTYVGISIALVAMAGLASGLTLGLMSLDEIDLEVLKRSGTEQEKKHARRIMPVIANEHFLLVTLLLWNAVSCSALPIFLDKLADPVTAVLLSVTVVLVIGEILPQAVCRSYGLQVGSYSALFVRLLLFLAAPIAWPIGKVLDWLLGGEQTALFRRAQLKALVGLHGSAEGLGGNLSLDEISIITGALDLTSKTACTAMTPLEKAFMLPSDRILDESTLQDVLVSGHSRIPVHEPSNRRKLLGLILVKELVLVDPEEGLTAGQLVSRSLPRLPANIPMYQLLKLFEAGGSHMVALTCPQVPREVGDEPPPSSSAAASGPPIRSSSFGSVPLPGSGPLLGLHRIKSGVIKTGEKELYIEAEQRVPISPRGSWGAGGMAGWAGSTIGSPVKGIPRDSSTGEGCVGLWGPDVQEGDTVGIITIEDVIEELLQQEIIDETDQYVDNLQVTRVDAYNLTTSLPPRLRKAYAQQFTPRVGRLVVHHPSHHHQGTGSWKGLTVIKQQQVAPRGAYSNPTTPLAGSPDSSSHASPMSALAAFSGSSSHLHPHQHSRLSSESHTSQQHVQHMEQVPEQQQLQLGAHSGLPVGLHNPGHGLRAAAVHLPTRTHQHLPAELSRRNSADTPGVQQQGLRGMSAEDGAFGGSRSWGASASLHSAGSGNSGSTHLHQGLLQRQQQLGDGGSMPAAAAAAASAAALGSVAVRGASGAHSGARRVGVGAGAGADRGAHGSGVPAAAAGFGSVVEMDGLKQPLLSLGQQADESDGEEL